MTKKREIVKAAIFLSAAAAVDMLLTGWPGVIAGLALCAVYLVLSFKDSPEYFFLKCCFAFLSAFVDGFWLLSFVFLLLLDRVVERLKRKDSEQ